MQKYMSKDSRLEEIQNLDQFLLPANFRGRSSLIVQLWWLIQATLFRWSPQVCYRWRVFLLRLFGARIGKNVLVRPSATITYPWKLVIGDYSWIGDEVTLYTLGELEIGAHSVISQKSYICTASHDMASATFEIFDRKVTIGSRVWIAADVFVAPGVTVADGCVVGARSSVFGNLPPMMVCYGYPAIPVRLRLPNESGVPV
jgi:putative colanic acid biosynthesis acetyltransferase WcaF